MNHLICTYLVQDGAMIPPCLLVLVIPADPSAPIDDGRDSPGVSGPPRLKRGMEEQQGVIFRLKRLRQGMGKKLR